MFPVRILVADESTRRPLCHGDPHETVGRLISLDQSGAARPDGAMVGSQSGIVVVPGAGARR